MNRREMLAGLLSLPFVPKFLRPKKKEFVLRQNHWEAPCDPCRAQVIAVTETGNIALTVTDHTKLKTTAECTVPCVITQVVFHVEDMLVSMLPEGSRIEVGEGDILVIEITHHYEHSYSCTKKSHIHEPTAVFMLGKDRKTIDRITGPLLTVRTLRITSNQEVTPANLASRWDEKNNILLYYNLCEQAVFCPWGQDRVMAMGESGLWHLAGLHHWRILNNEKPLQLSLWPSETTHA